MGWSRIALGGALLIACKGAPPPTRAAPQSPSGSAQAAPARVVAAPAPPAPPPPQQAPAPAPPVDEAQSALALPVSHSTSLGAPGGGELKGAVALPLAGPGFRFNPRRPDQARYGTVELVQAIIRSAALVKAELPGSELTVNDLGLEHGGRIRQHGSHQSGRDADILFYMQDEHAEPLPAVGVPLDPKGRGTDFKDLTREDDDQAVQLDRARTWRFIQALLESSGEHVQRIFLAEHLRGLLLREAERVHAPLVWQERFGMLTCQPEVPHDDHMHVRLYCSPEDLGEGCLDTPPIYPWHEAALALLGLAPKLERPADRARRRTDVAERTTTIAEARDAAGPMHWKVKRFLDQREHWAKPPRTGRPYCR
jgi:penicillin-insensitive murein endopeptidase